MSVFTLNKNNEKINNINISTFDKNNNISSKKFTYGLINSIFFY